MRAKSSKQRCPALCIKEFELKAKICLYLTYRKMLNPSESTGAAGG